ncbi:MAG: hypothetical protein K0V04_36505, partial [Deltaproteobacteria bacterium]|nr:hypothetical protein [Deltaproteobacteria bacterium]
DPSRCVAPGYASCNRRGWRRCIGSVRRRQRSLPVARLGMSRQDPGVRAIVLPDRIVTLAPGCDHAQIKVDVRDGKTVQLDVVVGEIRQRAREGVQAQ